MCQWRYVIQVLVEPAMDKTSFAFVSFSPYANTHSDSYCDVH